MDKMVLTLSEIELLSKEALLGAGTNVVAAHSVAKSTVAAEADGIKSHGLIYVPIYCEHVLCGKVIGEAIPEISIPSHSAVVVDAKCGFAHPAIDLGFEQLVKAAKNNGVACLAIRNSYNCGILGHHTERLARQGLLGLGFTNSPAAIAPTGGNKPIVGTNPFSLAVPDGSGGIAFIIDQSASVIAKSEIALRARENTSIPEGWALDAEGQPTTDAKLALKGSMLPSGGYKGFGVGLMVEVFAAALSGALLGTQASPFAGTAGGPPKTGQCFFAINTDHFSGGEFADRIQQLVSSIDELPGARLPGNKRLQNRVLNELNGVEVPTTLIEKIRSYNRQDVPIT